jgi:two-component system OmpR family response regulator
MKLLLVEDDEKIACALVRALTADGFTVDHAADGDDGLWMATEAEYDLIVLDVMLPRRDGFQVCADLRAAGNWTPVLMLTARDDESAQTEGLDVGADDYLTKPVSFAILAAHIRSILRRSARCTAAPLTVGTIRIDPRSRQAWSSDVQTPLTHREFDVLEFLMRRQGQAVSKDAILRGVWEFDFDGSENIVQVYVTRLRRKLDGPHGTAHIHTVHGVGYRLDAQVA